MVYEEGDIMLRSYDMIWLELIGSFYGWMEFPLEWYNSFWICRNVAWCYDIGLKSLGECGKLWERWMLPLYMWNAS